jgi:cytochrome b6-f complex iron-sulfur subunit
MSQRSRESFFIDKKICFCYFFKSLIIIIGDFMKRRSFLKFLTFALGATAASSLAYPLVKFLAPPQSKTRGGQISIKKSDIPLGEGKEIVWADIPAVIVNVRGMGYIALSRVCTHLGCLVEYNKEANKFICPCHAGVFNVEGNVISGPPPRPLAKLPLTVQGDKIVIG